MANAKEIVGDVHKVLAGISTGVVGIFGGPAAAQGIQTASGAVQGMLEKYIPEPEVEPSNKSPVPPSQKSPAPPTSKTAASEPRRAERFDQTDFKSRTARDTSEEQHEKRMKELRAQLSAARAELAARQRSDLRAAEIVDLNPTENREPLVNDARNARSVNTADGTLILDLGPMAKQTDATRTVDYLRTLGYSETEIDQLLAGPAVAGSSPARKSIAFKTLEIFGRVGDRIVPLADAIEQIGGRWRPRRGMAVSIAHTADQGFGLAGVPGRWPEDFPDDSPENYGLNKDRAVLYWDSGKGKARVATAGLLSDLFSDWQKTLDQV